MDVQQQNNAIKANPQLELNIKTDKILKLLVDNKIAYHVVEKPESFLVHPSNRGGLMVNCHDVHDKGHTMLKVGAQLSKLTDSVAFELSRNAQKRQQQLQKNKDLVAASNEMLASLNGSERYLTVGSSHTMSFCKAVLSGCKTMIPELSHNGCLSLGNILAGRGSDHPFQIMCATGWEWLILPEFLEDLYPDLPAMIQQSLNSSHAVAKPPTEMETAATIAEYYAKMKMSAKTANLALAVQAAGQSEPRCKSYLHSIANYVQQYAGGDDFPIIHFLQNFSVQFGCSLVIGEEFMDAITNLQFKTLDSSFPWIRAACLAAQLTSPKATDGIAKLLNKSDLEKLKHMKGNVVTVAESTMAYGWKVLQQAQLNGLSPAVGHGVFGKFLVRCILKILDKEKYGREPKGFESLVEINELFCEELNQKISGTTTTSLSSTEVQSNIMMSLDDTADSAKLALQTYGKHLKLNGYYVNKEFDDKPFLFESISSQQAKFVHKPFFADQEINMVDLSDLKNWKLFRGNLPMLCSADMVLKSSPQQSDAFATEKFRANIFASLAEAYSDKMFGPEDIIPSVHPDCLFANRDFKKAELKLIPYCNISKCIKDLEKVPQHHVITIKASSDVFVMQVPKLSINTATGELKDGSIFSPFFWVKSTEHEQLANMDIVYNMLGGMFKVPVLINSKPVKKYTQLLMIDASHKAVSQDGNAHEKLPKTSKRKKVD